MMQWIAASCVLILAVLALRLVLKGRISLRLQYALWLLVAIRLLVPLSFGESRFSAANISQNVQPVVQRIESVQIPVQSFESAYEEVVLEHMEQGKDISGFESTEALEYKAYEKMNKVSLSQILLWVWVSGMALSFAVLLFSNLHFAAKLRKTRTSAEIPNCKLSVFCAPQIVTPCLFGIFRPAIYLTEDVLADPEALEHVLAHESAHHRHGDHLWAIVRGICLCIHWYNPLVWAAAVVSQSDGELACDEAAIARLGEEKRLSYGRTLIGLTCAKGVSPLLTATTMTGSKHSIKERITLIAKKPKFSVIALIALILAITIAAGCSFTGPADDSKVLEFPGTQWGMTLEEVMQALELTEDDITVETDESGYIMNVKVEIADVFGAPAAVTFNFESLGGNSNYEYLDNVYVYYPDDTDMDAVRRKMIRLYGEPTAYDAPPQMNLDKMTGSEGHVSRWDSEALLGEFMSEAYTDYRARSLMLAAPYEYGLHEANQLKENHAATLWWTDDGNWMTSRSTKSETPGQKGLVFSANELAYIRTVEKVGMMREIPMDESLLSDYLYALRQGAIRCIIRQELNAGIAIADARINIKEVPTKAQPISSVYESVLYEITWQVRPETTNGILLGEGEVLKDGWIIPAEPTYYMVEHLEGVNSSYNGIHVTEETNVCIIRTASAIEAEYGTAEMLEQYGDMFTALMMENARRVNLEIKP